MVRGECARAVVLLEEGDVAAWSLERKVGWYLNGRKLKVDSEDDCL